MSNRLAGLWRSLFARSTPAKALTQETRQPQATRPWAGQRVLAGITPQRLAAVLRDADLGNFDDYLLAAQELEERDSQYGSQMVVRRTAVSSLELSVVKPQGAGARASAATQALIDSGRLGDVIHYLLDALGKGFAISQIVWEDHHGVWMPRFVEHDQREFSWKEDPGEWRLRDGSMDGLELTPAKWVIHEPRLRSGLPIRRGLARPAMFLHMAKWMSLTGWVTLMKLFGVPLAVAHVGREATQHDRAVLRAALSGLGQGVNAIVPEAARVEVIKAADAGSSPERLFSVLLEYIDRQITKLVLGQTMTADNGSSHAQATVHNEVRADIREGDAEQLANTLNRDVVRPFIDLNIGPQRVYPSVQLQQADARDLVQWSNALVPLLRHGLRVKTDEVYPLFGLTKPGEADEVIGGGLTGD